jgi:hypothetical protein
MRFIVAMVAIVGMVVACGLQLASVPDAVSDAGGRRDATEPVVDSGVPLDSDAGFADATQDTGAIEAGIDPQCPVLLGELGYWSGKVNVHRDPMDGGWAVDTDCNSGANVDPLVYCKKYWGAAETVDTLDATTPESKPFTQGGKSEGPAPACGGLALGRGVAQHRCCKAPP